MRLIVLVSVVLAMAGCGADGPPRAPQAGVSVTGEATVGVTGKL